jgi:phenylacetate-CoA ligase
VKIPPTTKDDLQQANWEFLCIPKSRVVEFTTTSGTMGKPVTIALSAKDVERLAYNEAVSFACAGGSNEDLYHLMLTLDRQFMAGLAYYEGIRKLGAGLVRVGPGLPDMQWETIQRLKPSVIVAVPSFIIKLVEYASHHGIDVSKTSVRKAICIGENIRTPELEPNALAKKINSYWDIELYGTYASTEMQTAFSECSHRSGGHHHPELIIVEILDEDNKPVASGLPGEVTITTLGVEAMPLLRYKTGDMAQAYHERCACGRTTLRLGPILGRKQQLLKFKGTTVYPPAIFDILNETENIIDFAVEAFTGKWNTDELKLFLVVNNELQSKMFSHLSAKFQSRLRVLPEIVFIQQGELEKKLLGAPTNRKIRKFIDIRQSAIVI